MEQPQHEDAAPAAIAAGDEGLPIIHRRFWSFTRAMVEDVPELPGVYALWREGDLVYYGCAGTGTARGLRGCLLEHLDGCRGARRPTHYSWEITHRPQARHVELLNRYWWAFKRLPRGNDVMWPRVAVLPPK